MQKIICENESDEISNTKNQIHEPTQINISHKSFRNRFSNDVFCIGASNFA